MLNEDILTNNELEYLKFLLKPFNENVMYIMKYDYYIKGTERVSIFLKNKDVFDLPYFSKNRYFTGLISDVNYTLSELGISYE